MRTHGDIKLVATDKRRNQLASETNYHTTKYFPENLMAIEMKKAEVKMNKPVYLGMLISGVSKTLMYEFWYDYVKWDYQNKAKLCYTDTGSFIIHIKTKDFCEDIANDVEKWFEISNYDENNKRPLQIGNNKKVIGLFKAELGRKIIKEFIGLRAKTYVYLRDNGEHEKTKGIKKCVIKRRLMFENYADSLFNDKIILKLQQQFKSDYHNVCIKQINKISLSSNDDKRMQTFDKITTYPYGKNAF